MDTPAAKAFRFRKLLYALCALTAVCFALFLYGCAASPHVVINEVVSSGGNSYVHETLGNVDWIELYNPGETDLDLKGYSLTDKETNFDLSDLLPSVTVPAGGYAVIPVCRDALVPNGTFALTSFGLSKSGDSLCLLSPSGEVLEKISVPALGRDVSYARRADGTFGYCLLPTPGAENTAPITDDCPLDTEGTKETGGLSPVALRVTEVMTVPLSGSDWVELYNPSDIPVNTAGLCLTDDAAKRKKAVLPALEIAPHAYVVLSCSSVDGDVMLGLSADGEELYLFDAAGALVDFVPVPSMLDGQSWAFASSGSFGYCGVPTPGAENVDTFIGDTPLTDVAGDIVLNEVLFKNTCSVIDTYGDFSDLVELYNRSGETVPLDGYYLSDDFSDPTRFSLAGQSIAPHGYLLVFLSGKESASGELHAPFSLGEDDDGIMLYHAQDRSAQSIAYDPALPPDVSAGFGDDGELRYYYYPTPGRANGKFSVSLDQLGAYPAAGVFISEVSAGGTAGEWIELCNGSGEAVDLTDWSLTDDALIPRKTILSGPLAGGGYLSVRPDGFGISFSGETLFLFDAKGDLRDRFTTGALTDGLSSGRNGDGKTARLFFRTATPGGPNIEGVTIRTPRPLFSEYGLYHDGPFTLSISCADPDATVYYTLDGSTPAVTSPVYTGPIPVSATVTVHAMAISAGKLDSQVETVHFVLRPAHTLPVLCLAAEPSDWTYFSTQNKKRDITVQCAYFEDGALACSFPASLNLRGEASASYKQKSFALHLRASLGQASVTYPFWGEGTSAAYASFVLRNASQDLTNARLRDSFAQRAAARLDLDTFRTRPVIVYVNGVYHGIYDFNECLNHEYFRIRYGADEAGIDLVKGDFSVKHGSDTSLRDLFAFCRKTDFSSDAALDALDARVDIGKVTDYIIVQTFFNNYDFQNQLFAASSDGTLKWRPVLYDVDRCFTSGTLDYNIFRLYFQKGGVTMGEAELYANTDLFVALRSSPAWCARFVERYAELLCTELRPERLKELLSQIESEIEPEMEEHIARWGNPSSVRTWKKHVETMADGIDTRYTIIQKQVRAEFGVSEQEWNALMDKYKQ